MKLPVEPLYSPVVDVKVFDNRVIHRPLLGATTIKLATLLPWLKNEEVQEIPEPTPDVLINMEPTGDAPPANEVC